MRIEPTFRGRLKFCSNMQLGRVYLDGIGYDSVEHAYQAGKFLDDRIREKFRVRGLKPQEAKRLAHSMKHLMRPDWLAVQLPLMEDLVRQKFKAPDLRLMLLNTKDEVLVEGNYWHDNFFGACTCDDCKPKPKSNHLGLIIMKVRKEIQEMANDGK